MDERDEQTQGREPEEKEEIVYASPRKRFWAWVGVIAMVLLTLAFAYATATGGIFWA